MDEINQNMSEGLCEQIKSC